MGASAYATSRRSRAGCRLCLGCSSNARTTSARTVELLEIDADGAPATPADYDDYAAAAADDLDPGVTATRRVEQAFLRRVLLNGRGAGTCVFCGRALPADLLVAAHVKRRADLSREERLDFRAVAVLACRLGCDALYEAGYLAVDADGRVATAAVENAALAEHLAGLAGLACPATTAPAQCFDEHSATCR